MFSAQQESSLPSNSTEDPYHKEKSHNPVLYYYYRLVNPWIRFLIIIPILYLYSVSSAVLTYRGNLFQERVDALLKDPKSWVPGSHPLHGNDQRGWFILYDLGFDAFPPATVGSYPKWKLFCDFTPIFLNVLLFVLLFIRRDCIRLFEYGWCQIVLFATNGLVHVLTSLPDAGGVQESCYDPKYYDSGRQSWFWSTFLTAYCGDMMWSGHTVNTLLPMIIIRRLTWDLFGWHFSYHDVDADPKAPDREKRAQRAFIMRHQQLRDLQLLLQFSTYDVEFDSSQAFAQFVFMAHERAQLNYNPNLYSKDNLKKRGFCAGFRSEDVGHKTVEPVHEAAQEPVPIAVLEEGETTRLNNNSLESKQTKYNDALATSSYFEAAKANKDHDLFFHVKTSPYVTPLWAARHRQAWWCFLFFARCLAPIWFAVFVFSVIVIRYHYTADIVVAILAVLAVTFNPPLTQSAVRYLYRPYYHNYLIKHWWSPYYPNYPLNVEQVNLEERLRRMGYGGLF